MRDWNALIHVYHSNEAFIAASLHKESSVSYIAYEKWTSKEAYMKVMNDHDGRIRSPLDALKGNCNSMNVLHSMDVVEEYAGYD